MEKVYFRYRKTISYSRNHHGKSEDTEQNPICLRMPEREKYEIGLEREMGPFGAGPCRARKMLAITIY